MNHAIAKKLYKDKPYKGRGMEGATARWYASLTRNSLERFQTLAGRVAADASGGAERFATVRDLPIPPSMADLFVELPASEFRADVSATELRRRVAGEVEGGGPRKP